MNYSMVGTALLKDTSGVKIPAIVAKNMMNPTAINLEILQQWTQTTASKECTWRTLVAVLRENNCTALADDIEEGFGKC